jgi:MFS family permease
MRAVRNPVSLAEIKNLGTAYWWVVAVASVFTLARFSEAFLVLRAQNVGVPIMLTPAVLVAMNVIYALAAYPAGVISDRISRTAVLASGMLVLVAADIVLALLPSIGGLALGVTLWGLHMGLTQGLLAALVADTAPAELRGTAYGFFNLLGGVAMLAASVIAGALWDIAGPQVTFLAGAGFALVALAGLLMVHGQIGGKAPE